MEAVLRVIIIVLVVGLAVVAIALALSVVGDIASFGMSSLTPLGDPDGGEYLDDTTWAPFDLGPMMLKGVAPGVYGVVRTVVTGLISLVLAVGAVLIARGVLGHD